MKQALGGSRASRSSCEKDIVVGVAIDIDARMMWFASNGEWDEEKAPSFGPEAIPKGQDLIDICM